jgi:hypothetical protein
VGAKSRRTKLFLVSMRFARGRVTKWRRHWGEIGLLSFWPGLHSTRVGLHKTGDTAGIFYREGQVGGDRVAA